jgi:hypothetical protein
MYFAIPCFKAIDSCLLLNGALCIRPLIFYVNITNQKMHFGLQCELIVFRELFVSQGTLQDNLLKRVNYTPY